MAKDHGKQFRTEPSLLPFHEQIAYCVIIRPSYLGPVNMDMEKDGDKAKSRAKSLRYSDCVKTSIIDDSSYNFVSLDFQHRSSFMLFQQKLQNPNSLIRPHSRSRCPRQSE